MPEPVPSGNYEDEGVKKLLLKKTEEELHREAVNLINRLPPEGPRGVLTDRQRDYYRQLLNSGQLPQATRDEVGNEIDPRGLALAGSAPLIRQSPTVPRVPIGLNNGLPPTTVGRREREPSAPQQPSGLDAAFIPGTFEYLERRRRESAEFFRRLTDAEIASNLTRYHTGRLFIDQSDVVGFLDVVSERLASGRIVFAYDPSTKRFIYQVNGAQITTQGAVLISNGVLRQAVIDLAQQLAAESRFTGLEDKPFPNTPDVIGQIVLGGVIGGVLPDLPGGQIPPSRQPRPPVDNAGNRKPPGPFPDELFRRNPPDP